MDKMLTAEQAIAMIPNGSTIMIGEFGLRGCPDDLVDALGIGQDFVILPDCRRQFRESGFDFLPLHAGQSAERHGHDRLCLLLSQLEACLEVGLRGRGIGGGADDGDAT